MITITISNNKLLLLLLLIPATGNGQGSGNDESCHKYNFSKSEQQDHSGVKNLPSLFHKIHTRAKNLLRFDTFPNFARTTMAFVDQLILFEDSFAWLGFVEIHKWPISEFWSLNNFDEARTCLQISKNNFVSEHIFLNAKSNVLTLLWIESENLKQARSLSRAT